MKSSPDHLVASLPPNPAKQHSDICAKIDISELRKSPLYGVKVYADAAYEGELLDGRRHGRGVMRYNNGRMYEGEWLDDARHGQGHEKYSNGNVYDGYFSKGRADGRGIYTWNNGESYDGEWKCGLKHGSGMWKGAQGDTYVGSWHSGKADGYGVHTWKSGDRYEGQWKSCLKHGKGKDYFANGDTYDGEYISGKQWGYGIYMWKGGSSYAGYFQNGQKHGFGRWRKGPEEKTNIFEGQYFRDKKDGFGVYKWASGCLYIGQYRNDERDGLGEMRWADGSRYVGQWAHGIQHGYGRILFPNGVFKEGRFENNAYVGPADKELIHKQLRNPDFDILSLSHDCDFSQEILKEINAQSRPLMVSCPEHPLSKYRGREFPKDMPALCRPRASKGPRSRSCKRAVSFLRNSIDNSHTRTTTSDRERRNLGLSTVVYNNGNGGAVTRAGSRRIKRRQWVPSGVVHYVNETSRPPVHLIKGFN